MKRIPFLGSDRSYRVFDAIKYVVYLLLTFNVFLFLREELSALDHLFVGGVASAQWIQVFSATIDTAAWVVLLLLFELETWVLDDDRIVGWVKRALHGVRAMCYVVIVYALSGYYAELTMLMDVVQTQIPDVCDLANGSYSILLGLDEYAPLSASNCALLGAHPLQITGFPVLSDGQTLQSARWLAWTDVINAAVWILICVLLEFEVRLQLRGRLSERIIGITQYLKYPLYGTLFAAAVYWSVAGDFLDFWDAALWLFAFIFIELNVFEWQHESRSADVSD